MRIHDSGCSSKNIYRNLISHHPKIYKNRFHLLGISDHPYITCKHEKIAILVFALLMIGLYLGNHKTDQSANGTKKKVLLMRKFRALKRANIFIFYGTINTLLFLDMYTILLFGEYLRAKQVPTTKVNWSKAKQCSTPFIYIFFISLNNLQSLQKINLCLITQVINVLVFE